MGEKQTTEVADAAATVVIEQDAHSTLITLDDYINKALPFHLQKQLSAQSSSSGWSFTQGLLLGQLSVIVLLVVFIKFFVFSETKTTNDKLKELKKIPIIKKKENNEDEGGNKTIESILEKTYYNVETHAPESLDWFNVLIAQTINQFRREALTSDNIINSLNDFLEKADLPDYLDKINILELDIGDDYPIFSNCRLKNLNNNLQAKIDVDLSDTLTLGIETNLLLNSPKPLTAILPVQLSVSIVRFSGCLTVSLISDEGDEDKGKGTALMFAFSPDFRLEFSIKSLIGSRSKLENVPKISNLIENQLKNWFIERCVEPRSQVIRLPSMWPRRKNVRQNIPEDDEKETK